MSVTRPSGGALARIRALAATHAARRVLRRPQLRAVVGTAGVNVLITLVGSVGGLFLARVLGPTQRGDLVTILLWPTMIGTVVSVGITESTCYWSSQRPDKATAFMSTAAAASLVTGLVVTACAPWIASLIARDSEVARYLTLVLALTPAYIAGGVWMSALQAKRISRWNLTRSIQPLLYLFAIVSLWALRWLSLEAAVAVFAISLLLQTAYSAIAAHRIVGRHRRPDISLLRPLYSYGSKVMLAYTPQLINIRVDQLVLSVMPSVAAAQLGNYAVAASLSWLALPASLAFGSVAFPRLASATDEAQARRIERLSLLGAGFLAGASIGVISILAPAVVPTLFGKGYRDAVVALWLLAPGTVFLALERVLGDLLQGRGQPLLRSIGEGGGAVITVVLLFALIPRFGIRGAAITSSIAYAATFFFLLWGLRRTRLRAPLGALEA
jgi:O-antigen/teichoic acid export membrane protein